MQDLVLSLLVAVAAALTFACVALWHQLRMLRHQVEELRRRPLLLPPDPRQQAVHQPAPPPQAEPQVELQPEPPVGPPAPPPQAEPRPTPPPLPVRPRAPAPAPRVDLETLIGTRWLVFAGAAALFLGVAFLLKWSFDRGWFGPLVRVSGGATLGLGLWTAGWIWRQRYRLLAHGFFAAGSCVLYASAWAAHMLYGLVPHGGAFGMMLAITAVTLLAAARLEALPLAVLALLGGFATPALLPAAAATPHALLGYATLLVLAAVALRWLRRWQSLPGLALAGTALLVLGWSATHAAAPPITALLLWGTWFTLLFLCGCCGPQLWRGGALLPADALTAGASSMLWLLLVIGLQARSHGLLAAVLAALQAAMFVAAALRHRTTAPADWRSREALWLAAAVLLTATAPLALHQHALTVALALVGLLLVRSAEPLQAPRLTVVGLAAVGWAVLRALDLRLHDLPLQWDGAAEVAVPFARLSCYIELLVVAAVAALGWLRRDFWPAALLAANVLLVPIVAGEAMGVLVAQRWPHPQAGFDRALAFAWPLAASALLLPRAVGSARVGAMVAAAAAGVVSLLAGAVGPQPPLGAWSLQYALMLLPLLLAALAVRRRAATAVAVALLLACMLHQLLVWMPLWQEWQRDGQGLLPIAVFAAAMLQVVLVLGLGSISPASWLRATCWCALLAPATVMGWAMLVPDAFAAAMPVQTLLPLSFMLALPPAVLAIAAHRRGGDADRLTALLGSPLALVFALLAWQELEAGATTVEPRCLTLLLPAGVALAVARFGPGSLRGDGLAQLSPAAHLLGALVLLSREGWRLGAELADNPLQGGQTGLSICWALCASVALVVGIAQRLAVLRLAALGLFGLTLGKLVLVDLASLPLPYRVLSFLVLGAALMGGGYLYHRFASRIGGTPKSAA